MIQPHDSVIVRTFGHIVIPIAQLFGALRVGVRSIRSGRRFRWWRGYCGQHDNVDFDFRH